MLKDFKAFAMRGNIIDLAVGLVLGAAFGKVVSALVSGVILPPIGLMLGGVDFSELAVTLKEAVGDAEAVQIKWGALLQSIIDFVILAFSIFLFVRALTKKEEEAAPAGPSDNDLLTEIRDALKKK